jgi:signal transduction histidine kinase
MREKNTVLQQLMSELGKAKEEIKSNNKNKAAFIGSMSHILRTPLNTIIGYSEMLQEDAESTGLENYNAPLKKVIESARQLIEIVNDIFDLSIIEAGKMEFFLLAPLKRITTLLH